MICTHVLTTTEASRVVTEGCAHAKTPAWGAGVRVRMRVGREGGGASLEDNNNEGRHVHRRGVVSDAGELTSASGKGMRFDSQFNSEHDFSDGAVAPEVGNNRQKHTTPGQPADRQPATLSAITRTRIAGPDSEGV